jgi:signal transduction histidine kinase
MSRGQPTSSGDILDVHATINAVARLITPTARTHSVTVDVQASRDGLLVRGDEAELQNALINLTLNAVQACKPGGRVLIRTEMADRIHIRVTDTGCGIAPEHVKHIFEPFFSLRKGGTGLGLFLTLNSVRRWGGEIALESTAGEGSTFDVILPAASSVVPQAANA